MNAAPGLARRLCALALLAMSGGLLGSACADNESSLFIRMRMAEKAKRVVKELFEAYVANPRQLPPHISSRIEEEELHRVVCDYIAGMTDRFALDEHRKLFDPLERL